MTRERWALFASTMLERIGAYHAEHPDLQGLGREQLRVTSQPKLPKPAFDVALKKLAGSGQLVLDGAFVRLPSHEVQLDARGQGRLGDDRAASRRGAALPSAKSARPRGGDRPRRKRSAPRAQTRRPHGLGRRGGARPFLLAIDGERDDRDRCGPVGGSERRLFFRRAIPRPGRQRPQGGDPDPRLLRSAWRDVAQRRRAPDQPASSGFVRSAMPIG